MQSYDKQNLDASFTSNHISYSYLSIIDDVLIVILNTQKITFSCIEMMTLNTRSNSIDTTDRN